MMNLLLSKRHRDTLLLFIMSLIGIFWPCTSSAVNKNVWIEDPDTSNDDQAVEVCLGQTRDFTATTSWPEGGTWSWEDANMQSTDYPHSYASQTFSEHRDYYVRARYTYNANPDTSYTAIVSVIPRTIVSETEATAPSNRARTTIGVGESVTLTLSPAPSDSITWSLTAGNGSLSRDTGNPVTYRTCERADNPTIRATHAGHYHSISLTVIQPSSVLYENTQYLLGWCPPRDAGIGLDYHANVYYGPASVNFYGMQTYEGYADPVRTGFFLGISCPQHNQNGPHQVSGYVAGKGSQLAYWDDIGWSIPNQTFSNGTVTWPIMQYFGVYGGEQCAIEMANQTVTLQVSGNTTYIQTKEESGANISTSDGIPHWQ